MKKIKPIKPIKPILTILTILLLYGCLLIVVVYGIYEYSFRNKVYPGVFMMGTHLGNWTETEVTNFLEQQNRRFLSSQFVFTFEDKKWATDGAYLKWGYDKEKSAHQVFLIGRSKGFINNLIIKWQAYNKNINIEPELFFDEKSLSPLLEQISGSVNIPPEEGLFEFQNGKVTAFKTSKDGRKLNLEKTLQLIKNQLKNQPSVIKVSLPVETVKPKVSTESANNLGIKEIIGQGVSYFRDSITSRIYNISLAASRLHGILIPPGQVFSFNQSVGKITAETGYQKAYIIKEGKTVLDDGGGVCQVSTTLYRAALYSGLPIIERTAHTYRVTFYEPPVGLDATVFDPEPDFKFKNDTPAYILIQSYMNYNNQSLTFEFFGQKDGRKITLSEPVIVSQTPAPAPTYQDDPTLPKGVLKQMDTAHDGAKVYFTRKVERNNQVLIDEKIWSNYIPWGAVYLRGTKE
jgi:vancomycin resistance protein YoaR